VAEIRDTLDLVARAAPGRDDLNPAAAIAELQAAMEDDVGPLRDAPRLERALATIADLALGLGEVPCGDGGAFDMKRLEWFDLRNMLLVAEIVATAALARTESRGAHQREDHPRMLPEWRRHQLARRDGGRVRFALGEP
jgi:succinate dehydrogenase/fumarate reductase flavoprotein subunit